VYGVRCTVGLWTVDSWTMPLHSTLYTLRFYALCSMIGCRMTGLWSYGERVQVWRYGGMEHVEEEWRRYLCAVATGPSRQHSTGQKVVLGTSGPFKYSGYQKEGGSMEARNMDECMWYDVCAQCATTRQCLFMERGTWINGGRCWGRQL